MKKFILFLVISCTVIVFPFCHHDADLNFEPPKPPEPGPEFKCSHDTVYFQNSVFPVILTGCARSGCHDQATQKGDLVLDDYSSIYRLVRPFDPRHSELYIRLFSNSGGRMPPDNPLNLDQKSIIYWWIAQGAYNNGCDSVGCDSSDVTYASALKPIINRWCIACHSGSKPSGGKSLASYNDVVASASGGRLMGALRHEQGYSAMPKGGYTLSPCEINLFEKWIGTGKP